MNMTFHHEGALDNTSIHSPRIATLQQALEQQPDALEAFWQELANHGAPLIEPLDTPDQYLVTFVWRNDSATTEAVLVLLDTITDVDRYEGDISPHLMQRLANSDLWFKSYRLGSDLRASYQLYPFDPQRSELRPDNCTHREAWMEVLNTANFDPFNPERICSRMNGVIASVLSLPDAPPQPWFAPRLGVAQGHIGTFSLYSDQLSREQQVRVYTPHVSVSSPYHVLILFDGNVWVPRIDVRHTFDNLITEGVIPPMLVLMPETPDRGEDLTCNPSFAAFIAHELLDWAAQRWPISRNPEHTIVSGQSYGGLMAMFCGLQHHEQIGRVLSQSGSFWWSPDGQENEWLTQQFAESPPLPLECFMGVGRQEWMLLPQNQRLRTVLQNKGYRLHYREYNGGHDYAIWRGGLADGLIALYQ